jgi:hypothetical protein
MLQRRVCSSRPDSSSSSSRTLVTRIPAVAGAPPGANATAGPPTEIVRISPQLLESGGLDPSKEAPQNIAGFSGEHSSVHSTGSILRSVTASSWYGTASACSKQSKVTH